jgi:hypothetical protein
MNMTPVTSEAAEAIGHDGQNLHVTYRGGRTYVHPGVPAALHKRLMDAPSKGKFIAQYIRDQYPGRPA